MTKKQREWLDYEIGKALENAEVFISKGYGAGRIYVRIAEQEHFGKRIVANRLLRFCDSDVNSGEPLSDFLQSDREKHDNPRD